MLALAESLIRWSGALGVFVALAAIFHGIWQGSRRAPGRASGRATGRLLHSPAFYVAASLFYFGLCYFLWKPLPLVLDLPARIVALLVGSWLFFLGLGLVLWGRLALGRQYFVSTTVGAQLFERHRLVTGGPFALVRHPMYLGILLTGLGGILIYRTWTWLFVAGHFFGLMARARREEQALAAEFGDRWLAYCRRVPAFFPRLPVRQIQLRLSGLHPGAYALLALGVFFLPAIPAYIWLWPNVSGLSEVIANSLANLYAIIISLWIGLRWWNLGQLGFNRRGIGLSLLFGSVIIAGRTLVILSLDWGLAVSRLSPARLVGDFLFYFGLVGVGQELLFRGLLYRALDDWLGARWAIWGSSIGFGLWHLGQGPLAVAAMIFYGLVFALIRWRAGGILGLILVHGLIDFTAMLFLPSLGVLALGRPQIPHPFLMAAGLILIGLLPVYLWKIFPRPLNHADKQMTG